MVLTYSVAHIIRARLMASRGLWHLHKNSTGLYYGSLVDIINLPIDVMVAKEVVEKQVIEEGCLVLLRKKLPQNTEEQFSLRKVF